MLQDLRFSVRLLLKSPLFSAIVLITLALGIGANTAIFTVVDQVLLKPLPLNDPASLVRVQEQHRRPMNITGATFHDLHERSQSFAQLAAYRIFSRNVTDEAQHAFPEQVDTAFVSPDFFALAGVRLQLGREFSRDSYLGNASEKVILGDLLWRRMFGADPGIVGKRVLFHGALAEVAGVMPPEFSFPENVQAWVPLTEEASFARNRRAHLYTTLGRLKPGVSLQQARAELQTLARTIDADNHGVDPTISLVANNLQESMVGDVRPALLILLGAVGFVLLIACANVANLLLSRAVARQKDVAIRTALGASRRRMLWQMFSENLVLAVAGGVLGIALGLWTVKLISTSYPGAIPRLAGVSADWRVLVFVAFVSVLSALIAGVAPAVQLLRVDPLGALQSSARTTESFGRRRLRSSLLVAEIAMSVVLLTGAGLLIRSFLLVQRVDPGYDVSNLAVVPITLPGAKYDAFEKRLQFTNSAVENIRGIPGVRSAAAAGVLPLRPAPSTTFELVGKPYDPANEPSATVVTASPEFFKTMEIDVLAGRSFSDQDRTNSPTVVVINRAMANQYYSGENPVGHTVIMKDWGDPLPAEIVGVVEDVRQDSMESEAKPAVYFPLAQFSQGTLVTYLLAKTESNPVLLASSIREQIWSVDRQQPVDVTTMASIVAESLARRRFTLLLLGGFAGLALILATVGVYGVISYSVSQRTREFGIRMAIGAQRRDVLTMILLHGGRIAAAGIGIGLALAFVLTRSLQSLLFRVNSSDPITFVVVCAGLFTLALLASFAPAYKATRVDPMVALRYE